MNAGGALEVVVEFEMKMAERFYDSSREVELCAAQAGYASSGVLEQDLNSRLAPRR